MSSMVEAIAKQAQITFSRSLTDETAAENLNKLIRSVSRIRASDLRLNRDVVRTSSKTNVDKPPAPVTYIEVEENQTFSMGIFLLKHGARIPLHDHPGMHGILKVIKGTVNITSYSAVSNVPGSRTIPSDVINRIKDAPKEYLVHVEKHMCANISDKDEPCVLRPREGNFHEISSVGGTAAFLDILAPPYDMIDRDCHYYINLESSKSDSDTKTWLLRRSPPPEFWCDSAPYTGPQISL